MTSIKTYYTYDDFKSHRLKFKNVIHELMNLKLLIHEDITTCISFKLALYSYVQILTYKFRKGSCIRLKRKYYMIEDEFGIGEYFLSTFL